MPTTSSDVVESHDVRPGSILWLPALDELQANTMNPSASAASFVQNAEENTRVKAKIFRHPILVLSRSTKDPERIEFLLMSTFHGEPLYRVITKSRMYRYYLPTCDQATHPLYDGPQSDHTYRPVRYEDDVVWGKPGYICMTEIFQMKWRHAKRPWESDVPGIYGQHALCKESFNRVLRLLRQLKKYSFNPSLEFDFNMVAASTDYKMVSNVQRAVYEPSAASLQRAPVELDRDLERQLLPPSSIRITTKNVLSASSSASRDAERQPLLDARPHYHRKTIFASRMFWLIFFLGLGSTFGGGMWWYWSAWTR